MKQAARTGSRDTALLNLGSFRRFGSHPLGHRRRPLDPTSRPRGATSGGRIQYNRNTCHGQSAPQADVVLQCGDQNLCPSRNAVAKDPLTIRPLTAARLPATKV